MAKRRSARTTDRSYSSIGAAPRWGAFGRGILGQLDVGRLEGLGVGLLALLLALLLAEELGEQLELQASSPSSKAPAAGNKSSREASGPSSGTSGSSRSLLESESRAISRLPWLGSLPLVGALFRSSTQSDSRTRFYVFLRASVMRSTSFEDLKYLTGRDLEDAGLEEAWPRLEPRWIY